MDRSLRLSRRALMNALGAAAAAAMIAPPAAKAQPSPLITKPIPSSGEELPVIGLGSWITFNVGEDVVLRDECAQVMQAFFAAGGRLIDSSPMYGSSQSVIGRGLGKLGHPAALFAADKVWTSSEGSEQIEESRANWNIPRFDLLQVHNLVAWEENLATLLAMKEEGRLRYVGITTSEGRRHDEFEQIMQAHKLDFIQITYNILDREVEERILPLAADRGMAVIINRPFRQGELIDNLESYPLPGFAADIDCANWAQFLLKFIVSHPAVTCAIPATSRIDHVKQNMGAAYGRLPDDALRRRMIASVEEL